MEDRDNLPTHPPTLAAKRLKHSLLTPADETVTRDSSPHSANERGADLLDVNTCVVTEMKSTSYVPPISITG